MLGEKKSFHMLYFVVDRLVDCKVEDGSYVHCVISDEVAVSIKVVFRSVLDRFIYGL